MPTTNFVWDPVNDCVISELDGTGATQAVYTNEPQQYGGVLSQRRGSTSRFLHADALGTTRLLTSTAGATTDTYLFDAWGVPVASTGTTLNPFKWVGRYGYYTDNATGLLYVRARMYQPAVARWCSIDPLFKRRYKLLKEALAYYLMTSNACTQFVDPSGLICQRSDKCTDCNEVFKDGQVMSALNCLTMLGCKFSTKCVDDPVSCPEPKRDEPYFTACTTLQNDGSIVINQCCWGQDAADAKRKWLHEFTHAINLCRRVKKNTLTLTCRDCVAEEMAAYVCSGELEKKYPISAETGINATELIKLAVRSCQNRRANSEEELNAPVDKGPCRGLNVSTGFVNKGCGDVELRNIGEGDEGLVLVKYIKAHYKDGKKSSICSEFSKCSANAFIPPIE